MAGADHLLGLSLAAIRDAPQHPVIAIRDGRAGVPKLGGDAAIGRVLEHAGTLAVLNIPRNLATELEVVALVVDGPAAISLHVNRMAHARKNFVERLRAWQQADVGHSDQWQARPAGGSHGPVRTLLSYGCGGFARGHISD